MPFQITSPPEGKGYAMKDLSGDGKVTKKDVLIGRGVIEKKDGGMIKSGYKDGGKVMGYKNGGCVMSGRGVRNTKMV
tara:strand:- start:1101 stop:1331 length:231 start_codon:yes stop_codon:yes gene_type:complete